MNNNVDLVLPISSRKHNSLTSKVVRAFLLFQLHVRFQCKPSDKKVFSNTKRKKGKTLEVQNFIKVAAKQSTFMKLLFFFFLFYQLNENAKRSWASVKLKNLATMTDTIFHFQRKLSARRLLAIVNRTLLLLHLLAGA